MGQDRTGQRQDQRDGCRTATEGVVRGQPEQGDRAGEKPGTSAKPSALGQSVPYADTA